ncbi:MAG: hypothetical protein EHM67_09570 [Hyphomicrobiaceae bacterium]|nr:MAG: hypothetical protein EHM67_09570 [Hyphomicrobiaceae bacterium]
MLISKILLLMASSLALTTPALAQEQVAAFEYSPVVRLVRSGQFQAEVWRRDVRTDRSDLAWSNREIYPTTAAAMIEACTSLRKNFDAAFSCLDHQPVVLARDVGTDRNDHDPPARATRQQSAAPPTSKVAASLAAPQGRVTDRAPGNPRVTAVPMKSAVPAVKRKVVVYEYVITSDAKGAWYKDFWKNQERYFGGGGDGGGSGGEGGGQGY